MGGFEYLGGPVIGSGNGPDQNNGNSSGVTAIVTTSDAMAPRYQQGATLRDFLSVGFRRRRLIVRSFLLSLLGALLGVLLFGLKYEAEMNILVKNQRVRSAVTTGSDEVGQYNQDIVPEEDINSEVALLQSQDLLQQVVVTCGLQNGKHHWWTPLTSRLTLPGSEDLRIPGAVRKLRNELQIEPIKKSNVIQVTYKSDDPVLAARVLRTLASLYMAKHLQVHRPEGMYKFFQNQTAYYQKQLADAEARLADFGKGTGAVSAQTQRDIAVQKQNDFEAALRQTQADTATTKRYIAALEVQAAATAPRVDTQVKTADNPQLLADLKSTLNTLQLKRTELLEKYAPTYRLVQEVDAQIAQTQAAIAGEEKNPVREGTTDVNPTHQWVVSQLAEAKANLESLQSKTTALSSVVTGYRSQAITLDGEGLQQADLLRDVKTKENDYLLYLNRQEEARIADALDTRRVGNVAIAEAPIVPGLPAHSPVMLILLSFVLAGVVSAGSALAAEYLDTSLRTPHEVERLLDIPVLASLPAEEHDRAMRGDMRRALSVTSSD